MPFTKHFEHAEREREIYRRWEESGAFGADAFSDRPPFTISMPPPNATGTLHLGHAITTRSSTWSSARMILMTTYATGEIPFRTVYLHGLILDRDGEKMTKSKPEACIDPLDEIRENGADPLRISLVIGNSAGLDFRLSPEKLQAARHLVNKLWNAAKLVERILEGAAPEGGLPTHPINRWMLARAHGLVALVDQRMASWAFGDAAEQIRSGFWNDLCDVYLEAVKVPELADLEETRAVVAHAFDIYLRLLHPFLPFVTEEVWGQLGRPGDAHPGRLALGGASGVLARGRGLGGSGPAPDHGDPAHPLRGSDRAAGHGLRFGSGFRPRRQAAAVRARHPEDGEPGEPGLERRGP